MGPDAMIFVFWMLSFKPTFSLSSFTFIKRLFSSSSLSALRVVSSAYLRLLIFLLAILIPACASSSPAFLLMYSAYKLNKQGDNIQPWHTPFPISNRKVYFKFPISNFLFPIYKSVERREKGIRKKKRNQKRRNWKLYSITTNKSVITANILTLKRSDKILNFIIQKYTSHETYT